ncbi:MAG: cytochrome P450 [Halioglobus sp.]
MAEITFKPYSAEFAANPYAVYASLRDQTPIFFDPEWNVTFVTRHGDVSKLLVDSRLGRTTDHQLSPQAVEQRLDGEIWAELPNYRRYIARNLLETEGPDHARLRRLLVKAFGRAHFEQQRPRIQELTDHLLEPLLPSGKMELLEDLVAPLTVNIIATSLGMPLQDSHYLRPWSAAIVRLYEKDINDDDLVAAEQATTEFLHYLTDLLEQRRAHPEDDLISLLAGVEDEGLVLQNDELISTCMLLLNAGHESTVNAAGNGMLALLKHPTELQKLRRDPTLVTSAVEEMLRYDAPLQYFHRFVLEDMSYQGVSLSKGDTVGLLYGSANRDPAAFPQPDIFDITRAPNKHLTFGKGRHFCLGAPLARLELETVVTSLTQRIPGLKLAQACPEYHQGLVFRGLKELQLRW